MARNATKAFSAVERDSFSLWIERLSAKLARAEKVARDERKEFFQRLLVGALALLIVSVPVVAFGVTTSDAQTTGVIVEGR